MKSAISILLLFLVVTIGYSQSLYYDVQGTYAHPITKLKLDAALLISDIIPYYPAEWIMSYASVGISTTQNGKVNYASGVNEILNAEQIKNLKAVDLGTDVVINIGYRFKNTVTDNIETRTMHYTATRIPEMQAEYYGGYQQMKEYLKEKAIDKIPEAVSKKIPNAVVRFTINENGEVDNPHMTSTSGDPKIDKLMLKAIQKMPKWKPAENANGMKVKQDFKFSVGNQGC